MFIAIYASGMPFNGSTIPKGESLGGSETAAYYMAKELAALGHRVYVFSASKETGKWDNVTYEWHGNLSEQYPLGDRFHFAMHVPYDVVIIQRHPLAFVPAWNSKLNIWWTHDLGLIRSADMVQKSMVNTDMTLTVSEFHKAQLHDVYGIAKDYITATTNGVDYEAFADIPKEMAVREKRSLIYTARPERGLENLVMKDGIMEMLPDCHLYVCGYDNTQPNMVDYYNYLFGRCKELPNVTILGHLGKKELYKAEAKVMLHVYPTEFEDTSCIAALEAAGAGTPFVASNIAALPETCKGTGSVLLDLKDGRVNKKAFADKVKNILSDEVYWQSLHKKSLAKDQSWKDAAKQWDALFSDMLLKKSSDKVRLHKHLIQMSDIVAVDKDGASDKLKGVYDFYLQDNYADHYRRYYEYERNRGIKYGPEDLDGQQRFEAIFDSVRSYALEFLKSNPGMRFKILDYGCAHGHITMNILKRLPAGIEIVGVDISESNIQAAQAWYDSAEVKGEDPKMVSFASFKQGEVDDIKDEEFNLILATEVLEHVADPGVMVDMLSTKLKKDGYFLITVPCGPWEAIGYDKHPEWRAHLHHLEHQDLFELWGHNEEYRRLALPMVGNALMLGQYLVKFKYSGPSGKINYDRKLKEQAPRETLSFCIIAKDAEYTIGRTLQNIKGIADEIIVGIDETTTDATEAVCKKFGAITFSIPSPLKIGFDAARNLTLKKATMNWIMWIDADETLEHPQNILKYLRNNQYSGYAVKQHHMAVEPLGCFQTDLPCRLFRNGLGIKFFGHVHEHPERELNEGVGGLIILSDVDIMHTGYATEDIRRNRFERNFPLMKIDREKHPERLLGKFLWLRDLAHLIKYTLERNGGRMNIDMKGQAEEVIGLWLSLLAKDQLRMAVDSLPYYSQAVSVLGGGIEYAVAAKASRLNGGVQIPDPHVGLFRNRQDIEEFNRVLVKNALGSLDAKYF